ncbi:MAG: FIST C-terminal domain-containing protein [Hahellaceae bacterium]|nr:FIST C-terminal domain-containing protein [Hahellaceae bacterium]
MKTFQTKFVDGQWLPPLPEQHKADWVLVFGYREILNDELFRAKITIAFPGAKITGCSTSGNVLDDRLEEVTACITAVNFEHTSIQIASHNIADAESSEALGEAVIAKLPHEKLRHVFVLADGHLINGSDMVRAMCKQLPDNVFLSGGLAGDGTKFEETHLWNENHYGSGSAILVGFYGDAIRIGTGHFSGWKPFGPTKKITKSVKNVLLELDGEPALDVYARYLGEFAEQLPASALRFPLGLIHAISRERVVRTILSIDFEKKSMVFAGNVPEGATCQFMTAGYQGLVEAAREAALIANESLQEESPQLAILVSCVGRRLVLSHRTEQELEAIREVLPTSCAVTGFYSYGEISSVICSDGRCGLLNQTLTATFMAEHAE